MFSISEFGISLLIFFISEFKFCLLNDASDSIFLTWFEIRI